MKEINGYLLFPVKENEKDFSITDDGKLRSKNTVNFIIRYRPLPKGNYSIVGLAKDLDAKTWDTIFPNRDGEHFLDRNNLKLDTTLILKNENR